MGKKITQYPNNVSTNPDLNSLLDLSEKTGATTYESRKWTLTSLLSWLTANGQAGKSAYEVAVDNGFVGTESDWLLSLVGADGADGADGKSVLNGNGNPAANEPYVIIGVNGDFYIDKTNWLIYGPKAFNQWGTGVSLIGQDGADGANGADGADGQNALMNISYNASLHTLQTGTLTLAVNPAYPLINLGWRQGTRLRIWNSPTKYMEGQITSAIGNPQTTGITVNIDYVVGSGSENVWYVGVCGDPASNDIINSKQDKNITFNRWNGSSYIAVPSDNGKLIEINSSTPATITINASTFTAGNQILFSQYGAGQVTIVAGSGVTFRNTKLKTNAQGSLGTIICISASEFYISGDLTA